MALSEPCKKIQFGQDESNVKLVESLDQALLAYNNCTEPADPQARTFKRQIESGEAPTYPESDPVKQEIIIAWVNMHRDILNSIFTEVKWFRRRD